jgi:PAS domain S-box-containing protein
LYRIYDTIPSLIIFTNKEGLIEYVNSKFTEVTGYCLEEVKGKSPRILKGGETKKEVYEELWKTISSKKAWNGEFHNSKKNREKYWCSISIRPVLDKEGNIVAFCGVQEEITAIKKAQEEIRLFNNLAVDRELRMLELKKEINSLLVLSGKFPKYKLAKENEARE